MCYFSKIMKVKKTQNNAFLHYYQNGDRPFLNYINALKYIHLLFVLFNTVCVDIM